LFSDVVVAVAVVVFLEFLLNGVSLQVIEKKFKQALALLINRQSKCLLIRQTTVNFNGISLQVIETRQKEITSKVCENGAKKVIQIERLHNYYKSIT